MKRIRRRSILPLTILMILITLLNHKIFAQELRAEYIFSNMLNGSNETNNTILFVNDSVSLFKYGYIEEENEDPEVTQSEEGLNFNLRIETRDKDGSQIFRKIGNDTLNIRQLVFKDYYLSEDVMNHHDWKLHNESKTINKLNCNKATVTFRGRNYIAWYAPSIPVDAGPYKFYGLPGLIIDVYDDENTIRFSINRFKFTDTNKTITFNFDEEFAPYSSLRQLEQDKIGELFERVFSKLPRNVTVTKSTKKKIQYIEIEE